MKIRYRLLCSAFLLLIVGGAIQSCREEDFDESVPDRDTLVAQGRYVRALNAESPMAIDDPDRSTYFEVGTPYRLVAFTKPYDKDNTGDVTPAETPRFNKVARETEATNSVRFVNLNDQPDKWLGFSAIDGETGGTDNLVSLDFYGFTYGKSLAHTPDYIELDGLTGESKPAKGSLATLRHHEVVTDGVLADLMRGSLMNQNIVTAGNSEYTGTQSVIPFKHCFSRLRFMVVQQSETAADGTETPCFSNIAVENVKLTGTYNSGYVYLRDGKVELPTDQSASRERNLIFDSKFTGDVSIRQVEMGQMIVFPSDGSALYNTDMADGYNIGLEIKVKSTDSSVIDRLLANTNPENRRTVTTETDGTYSGIIVKNAIIDNYSNLPIRLHQNTAYTLVVSFQQNVVRIITVIPQLEEWLPGEGTPDDPWQEQPMGQPQMFDNVVWSDRNLGADHYNPMGAEFEKTIGYFYQSGRNIPYYPFDTEKYYDTKTGKFTEHPDPYKKNESVLADVKDYNHTRHRFYPIVDPEILKMKNQMSGWGTVDGNTGSDRTWMISRTDKPQIDIPEKKPTDKVYFDFMRSPSNAISGLTDNWAGVPEGDPAINYDMHWEMGKQNQPVSGAWVIPTSSDFMSIFPTTPHAGNITFRGGGWNGNPMGWGGDWNDLDGSVKTLRVTVPYYVPGGNAPADWRADAYRKAWTTLRDHNDAGTTHLDAYSHDPGEKGNVDYEPDGDPSDGYASAYVISREDGSVDGLPDTFANDNRYRIKSWGTIYAIKRIYTSEAYRIRWRVRYAGSFGTTNSAGLFIEVCRYRCKPTDTIDEQNYRQFDWEHPAARLYFPICGLGDWTGNYINFGTECEYATSDAIVGSKTSALQIKISGDNNWNAYMAIIRKPVINRDFGRQIRPIMKAR